MKIFTYARLSVIAVWCALLSSISSTFAAEEVEILPISRRLPEVKITTSLSQDHLLLIVDFLRSNDFINFSTTCKTIQNNTKDAPQRVAVYVHSVLNSHYLINNKTSAYFITNRRLSVLKTIPNLSLEVWGQFVNPHTAFDSIAQLVGNLRSLNLHGCSFPDTNRPYSGLSILKKKVIRSVGHLLGEHYYADVNEAHLRHLGALVNLQRLVLTHPKGPIHIVLQNLPPSLKHLGLVGWQEFTDNDLEHLRRLLPDLHGLDLESLPRITNDGLRHLPALHNLQCLNLRRSPITDGGIQHVSALSSLKRLELWELPVTDRGLQHLCTLPDLRDLVLGKLSLTNEGIQHVSTLSSLKRLSLYGLQITDYGLQHLHALPGLQYIDYYSSFAGTTDDGRQRLEDRLVSNRNIYQETRGDTKLGEARDPFDYVTDLRTGRYLKPIEWPFFSPKSYQLTSELEKTQNMASWRFDARIPSCSWKG